MPGKMTKAIFLLLLFFLSLKSHAGSGINSADLMDGILQRFANTVETWGSKMMDYGSWLFWSLCLISMVWTYSLMALRRADIQEFLAETVRFFATTGFFLWILRNGPAMAMAIIDSLRLIAADVSGLSKEVSPSGMMDIGFDIFYKVVDKSSIWSPASSIVGLIFAAIILIVLALVVVNMLLLLIYAWFLAYGAVFLLGFGGGRWTQDIAINYYKTVLGLGVQLFTMILIIGIGKSFIDQYYAAIGSDMALKELAVMLVVAIILLSLVDKLPPMIAGIVGSSAGGGGGGIGSFGAGAAMGAGALGAAMSGSASSLVAGGAANLAGGALALKAAFQAAQQCMSVEGGSRQPSSSGSVSSALGSAGRFAAEMGSNLASGTAQGLKEKMTSMTSAASERIAETVGGKIASAINATQGDLSSSESLNQAAASNDTSLKNNLDLDSLSAGTPEASSLEDQMNYEIDDFVNKPSFYEMET